MPVPPLGSIPFSGTQPPSYEQRCPVVLVLSHAHACSRPARLHSEGDWVGRELKRARRALARACALGEREVCKAQLGASEVSALPLQPT